MYPAAGVVGYYGATRMYRGHGHRDRSYSQSTLNNRGKSFSKLRLTFTRTNSASTSTLKIAELRFTSTSTSAWVHSSVSVANGDSLSDEANLFDGNKDTKATITSSSATSRLTISYSSARQLKAYEVAPGEEGYLSWQLDGWDGGGWYDLDSYGDTTALNNEPAAVSYAAAHTDFEKLEAEEFG